MKSAFIGAAAFLCIFSGLIIAAIVSIAAHARPHALFDGTTLQGWEGNLDWFQVEDGAIVGGSMEKPIPQNEFLCTTRRYEDFDLTLEVKLTGEGANAGIQFRTERIPNHHEVIGYQADMGEGYWGALYDESRRNKILAAPDEIAVKTALKPNDWNTYTIRAEGPRIRLWLNGVQTVDYIETDDAIARSGVFALQIHSGPPSEVRYRNIKLTPFGEKPYWGIIGYRIADWSLLLFHCGLMAFNMFGMLWRRTRLANLIVLLLTGGSWTLLGIWYGLGYCPLTDWHWQVKAKLGVTDLPNSYVKWLIDAPTGWNIDPWTADAIVVVVYVTALALSAGWNVWDWRRRVKVKRDLRS